MYKRADVVRKDICKIWNKGGIIIPENVASNVMDTM